MPCPLHNGKGLNFTYTNERYKCFVCGAHGSVIDFVMQMDGISFQDALKRIDRDCKLGLNIGKDVNDEQHRRELDERIERKRAKQAEKKRLIDGYHAALDEWIRLEQTIRNEAPRTPFDEFSDKYVDALHRVDAVGYALDEAERKLWEFEKESA